MTDFERGFDRTHKLGPAVTVFRSARFKPGHPQYELAREVGRELDRAGFLHVPFREAVTKQLIYFWQTRPVEDRCCPVKAELQSTDFDCIGTSSFTECPILPNSVANRTSRFAGRGEVVAAGV